MLHKLIPTAFTATIVRRYLDSLAEKPEVIEGIQDSIIVTSWGAPAALLTAGLAIYGLMKMPSKNKSEQKKESSNDSLLVGSNDNEREKISSGLRKNAKPFRGRIRKRYRKGKQWFMNKMNNLRPNGISKIINRWFENIPFIFNKKETPITIPLQINSHEKTEIIQDNQPDELKNEDIRLSTTVWYDAQEEQSSESSTPSKSSHTSKKKKITKRRNTRNSYKNKNSKLKGKIRRSTGNSENRSEDGVKKRYPKRKNRIDKYYY